MMEARKHPLGLVHYVLLGMCLGFGLSSIVLGVVIVVKETESHVRTEHIQRSKRDVTEDLFTTREPTHSHQGHIEVITKGTPEELFADETAFTDTAKDINAEDKIHFILLSQAKFTPTISDAIRKTWGSGLPHLDLVSAPDHSELFPEFQHLMDGLRSACTLHQSRRPPWTILARDTVYTNTAALRAVLTTLNPLDPLLIGMPSGPAATACSLASGSVLSSAALDRVCPRLHLCEAPHSLIHTTEGQDPWGDSQHHTAVTQEPSEVLGQCLLHTAALPCLQSSKVLPSMHLTPSAAMTASMPVFIGPHHSVVELYTTHLHVMENQIQRIQHNMVNLQVLDLQGHTEVTIAKPLDTDPRSKRESVWNDSDDHIPFQSNFLNSSMGPFRQFMEGTGAIYRDACRLEKHDPNIMDGQYKFVEELAEVSILTDFEADQTLTFGFKMEKPKVGTEYDFYFVDETETNVHQVTIHQAYDDVEVQDKDIRSFTDIHIITAVPDGFSEISAFLQMVHDHCEEFRVLTTKTCYMYLFLHSPFDLDILANVSHFETINPNFSVNYIEAGYPSPFTSILSTIKQDLSKDFLLLFLPADTNITTDIYLRCQANTKLQQSVYFPVGYHSMQQTDSNIDISSQENTEYTRDLFWMNQNFDTFCAYSSDIRDFEVSVNEAKDLYSLFQWAGFDTHRVVEPSLRLNLTQLCSHFTHSEITQCMQELRLANMA